MIAIARRGTIKSNKKTELERNCDNVTLVSVTHICLLFIWFEHVACVLWVDGQYVKFVSAEIIGESHVLHIHLYCNLTN